MSPRFFQGIEHLNKLDADNLICFDTETLQLQPERNKLRLLQLGGIDSRVVVVIDCFLVENWDPLRQFFHERSRRWIAHNAVFDLGWLQAYEIYPSGMWNCTMAPSAYTTTRWTRGRQR